MSRLPRSFLRPVGGTVRDLRLKSGLTLDGLAKATGLSKGLLSKIENFRAVPSLPVLGTIARALDVNLDQLLAEVQVRPRHPYLLIRDGKGQALRREDSQGFRYQALQAADCGGVQFQSFQLHLDPGCTREPRTTDGDEWLLIQRGAIDFLLGEELLRLNTGDSLYFDGRIPHAPRNPHAIPAQIVVIYLISPSTTPRGT